MVALRLAVGFGKDEPVIFACFDAECYGKFFPADIAGGIWNKAVIEVWIFLFQQCEVVFAFVSVTVIDDDNFKLWIVLF